MRIAWIGGLDRNEGQLTAIAAGAGHALEFHTGHTAGRGADTLRAIIERADYVVILTDVNSHGGVLLARRLCRQLDRNAMIIRTLGVSRFKQVLASLEVHGRLPVAV